MSRTIPVGAIPDTNVLPDGLFRLRVRKCEETTTKEAEGKSQKLMYRLQTEVVEPASYKGMLYTDNLVVGSEADPDAQELVTWQTSIGGKNIKKIIKATGIPVGDEIDADLFCQLVVKAEFIATIVQKVQTNEGKYKGSINNNVTAYWKVGEREAGLANGAVPTTTKAATGGAAPRATFRAASVEE